MSDETVIVGAGIYGAGLAWQLTAQGRRVTLIDQASPGSGASGGPGFRGIRGCGRRIPELALVSRAHRRWERLADELDGETGFSQVGSLRLYEERVTGISGGWCSASARCDLQNAFGVKSELLERNQLREEYPGLATSVIGALRCPEDGIADHTGTTRLFAQRAQEQGAQLRMDTTVQRVEVKDGAATALHTADGSVIPITGELVLLANTGVAELLAPLGVRLPIWTMRPQMIFAHAPHQPAVRALIGHDSRIVAIKWLPDGTTMISGGWSGDSNESDIPYDALPPNARLNVEAARAVLTGLDDARYTLDATRCETVSVDALPTVDRVGGLSNVLYGTGWTGHGFAISVAVTELIAEWLTTGRRPQLLQPFGADRFRRRS